MFEKLKGTISGIQEGIADAVETEKQEKARIRREKRIVAEEAQAAAKEASKEKFGQSKIVGRLAGLSATTQELHQKIKASDHDSALAGLMGNPAPNSFETLLGDPSGQPDQGGVSEHDPPNSFEALLGDPSGQSEQPSSRRTVYRGGGLPPI